MSNITIGEHLLAVADAGLAICKEIMLDENIFSHLTTLLAIEDALDKGRMTIALTGSGPEHKPDVTAKMDELRTHIRQLIDQCDPQEVRDFIERRSQQLSTQFNT